MSAAVSKRHVTQLSVLENRRHTDRSPEYCKIPYKICAFLPGRRRNGAAAAAKRLDGLLSAATRPDDQGKL
jgi:hypothetical protein